MVLLLIEYGLTVETMYPFKFHFPSAGKQILINAGGNVVHLIIRAHDAGHISISSKSCCETNGIRRVTLNPFQSSMSYGQPLSTGWDRHRHLPPLVKIS